MENHNALVTHFAIIGCLLVSMTAPLVTVLGKWDFHLFHCDETFPYRQSSAHVHSQHLHIASLVVMCFAALAGVMSIPTYGGSNLRQGLNSAHAFLGGLGSVLYTAASGLLVYVAVNLKQNIDKMPPSGGPETLHVRVRYGLIFEVLGMALALVSVSLSVKQLVTWRRSSYAPLST